MVSVTSIVPSAITIVSDWKFSMRSSRVLRAEAAGKTKTNRAMARKDRMAMRRTRVIPCAAPGSCRGRAEADLGRFPLGGCGDFEEFARLESQHVREDIRGELLDFGVQVADHGVVIASCILHGVLYLSERGLQRREALDGAELRIRLRKRKQALQRAGKHVLCLRLVTRAGRAHGSIARVDHRLQRTFLMSRVALDRLHQVRNQVVAPLE